MIETESQRRWWFATHPEYSWRHRGKKSNRRDPDEKSDKVAPEQIDTWVDDRLKYERDEVGIELLKQVKFWFGSAFVSKSQDERYALLWGDDEPIRIDIPFGGESGGDWPSQQPIDQSTVQGEGDRETHALGQEIGERMRREDVPLESDPHTALDLMPYRRLITSPIGFLKGLFRSIADNAVVHAAKKGATEGPGKWVEVCRARHGLEHQSRMSGQPIRDRNGKLYINEYEVNGVKFDGYRDGILYEYKDKYANFIGKNKGFREWFEGAQDARKEALDQVAAAKGIPVVWRVGSNQVEAFKKAVGKVPGLKIEP